MTTRNRGKQSSDDVLFAKKWHSILSSAADDLCFLLTRSYATKSALQVVGNKYKLNKRQRDAIFRVSCSDQQKELRNKSCVNFADLRGRQVEIDGFNLLILLESALSDAFVFEGRDGLYRDLSGVHGSYKRVAATKAAMLLAGQCLDNLEVSSVKWYLDQPVSNSGKLKTELLQFAAEQGFNWEVDLVLNPDKVLAVSNDIVVSSDGWILDSAKSWFNLADYLIKIEAFKPAILKI